jgi:hypothetical protein
LFTDTEYRPKPFAKDPVQTVPQNNILPTPNPTPLDKSILKKEDMFEWMKLNVRHLGATYHLVYALNKFFNTDEFTEFKPIKFIGDDNKEQEINPNIMLKQNVEPQNFINTCVTDLLDKKPNYDETRMLVYEDVFLDLFDYPTKIVKSEIDNEMIAVLMEQRRRGVAVDVEYMKKFVDYDKLSIYNKLNYQYLSNDFSKVQGLLFNQINIIKKNHMIFV